ncbi:hypothetical protein HYU07_02305 [Candidatus Woesearchaeota archaeon]|nr:hypothetical protein [Candidatus Woesearchaeota archaeon]
MNEVYNKALILLERLIEEAKEASIENNDEFIYRHLISEIRNIVDYFKDRHDAAETIELVDQAFDLQLNDFKKYTGNHFDALLLLLYSEKDAKIEIIPNKSKMLKLAGISNRHSESLFGQNF